MKTGTKLAENLLYLKTLVLIPFSIEMFCVISFSGNGRIPPPQENYLWDASRQPLTVWLKCCYCVSPIGGPLSRNKTPPLKREAPPTWPVITEVGGDRKHVSSQHKTFVDGILTGDERFVQAH